MAEDIRVQILINLRGDEKLQAALVEAEVCEAIDTATTCRARFLVDIASARFTFLDDERLMPGQDTTLTVLVTSGMQPTIISHGIIVERRIELVDGGAGSYMEILTADRRVVMDRACRGSAAPYGPVPLIVGALLGKYKFVPLITATDFAVFNPIMFQSSLNQATSDLALLMALAGQSDAHFWIDWPIPGFPLETAHFGPSPSPATLALPPSAKLVANAGPGSCTMTKFSSQWISEAPTTTGVLKRIDIDTGKPVDGAASAATVPRLGEKPKVNEAIECQVMSPGDAAEARRRQTAALNDASWVIRARARSSVRALGTVVRAHQIVNVDGVGAVDSGNYFVEGVRHEITTTDHLMNIKLRRNATGKFGGLGIGGF